MIVHLHKQPMTADDFLLIDNKGFELVDGRLKEKNVGAFSSSAAFFIGLLLAARFDWQKYGHLLDSEGGYQCWPDYPDRVRKPDISFIHREKLPGGRVPEGWIQVPPDFAIEVLSKKDTSGEVEEKVDEYLAVGVPLVWVVDPKRQHVTVYRPATAAQTLSGDDELVDEAVLPGFRCKVEELFAPAE